MKRRIWMCAAISFALAAGLVAQTSQAPQTSQSLMAKTITVTGCIQRAAETPTGTSGTTTAATTTTETKFKLTSVVASTAASTATTTAGTAGTTGAASSTTVASEYRLDADDAKLTPHVGHKVEIAGTVEPAASIATPQTTTASSATAPKLKVDSVKMIAAACP